MEDSPFEQVFIQPAAGDAGGALGAALLVAHAMGETDRGPAMASAALGPEYGAPRMRRAAARHRGEVRTLEEDDLLREVTRQLLANRIVGWFQGRMEFGPRALGQRSILANPCHPPMKDILNQRVKHREPFRPYGVSVLAEQADRFFHVDRPSPFMLQVANVREEVRDHIPAALHVNGTSRLQTVTEEDNGIYYRLIRAFADASGVPMVINTSFNDNNEPIVCTPEDAYACFAATGMDTLVMGSLLLEKEPLGGDGA
jgi:carbamoyltransferase